MQSSPCGAEVQILRAVVCLLDDMYLAGLPYGWFCQQHNPPRLHPTRDLKISGHGSMRQVVLQISRQFTRRGEFTRYCGTSDPRRFQNVQPLARSPGPDEISECTSCVSFAATFVNSVLYLLRCLAISHCAVYNPNQTVQGAKFERETKYKWRKEIR